MVITSRVSSEFFEKSQERLIRIAPHQGRVRSPAAPSPGSGPSWTNEEHNRFLEAMELFPSGPWKVIANYVGSKTPRQTMTHAQKYRQKIARRQRGLKTTSKQTSPAATPSSTPPPQTTAASSQADATFTALLMSNASIDTVTAVLTSNTTQQQYVPILPWSPATTPQMVWQEHLDFVHDAPPDSLLFENDDDLAAFLLEDYEPLLFSDDLDASLEDEQEISRILSECGW